MSKDFEDQILNIDTVFDALRVTVTAQALRVLNRMPVLLMPDEYDRWLNGFFDDALFQARCFSDALIEMTRTNEPWVMRTPAAIAG